MAKFNFWKRLFRGEKKDLGGMTITITQSGHQSSGSPSVGGSTGASNMRPMWLIGALPVKTQYWITGGSIVLCMILVAALTVWVDKESSYYTSHLNSLDDLKKSLVDLQANSYRVSQGLDAFAPTAYLEARGVEDALVYMRSTIFADQPELKGPARFDLDQAWNEWVSLKGSRDKLAEAHIALLTVRGKFASSRASVTEAITTLKLVAGAKPEDAAPEAVSAAKDLERVLSQINVRLDNSDSNVSYGKSALDMEGSLDELGREIGKFPLNGVKEPELMKKVDATIKGLKTFVSSTKPLNGLLVEMGEFRRQTGALSNGVGRVLQLADYAELSIRETLKSHGRLNWVIGGFALLGLLAMVVLGMVSNNEGKKRTYEAKNENEANQRAIMSLLDEIANLADGDLTVRATVTEEITGAIADSVNFAITELGTLVTSIKTASGQISDAANLALTNSTQLRDITNKQADDIKETGRSVLNITEAIEQVSKRMEDSKRVAKSSVDSSARGMQAVSTSIGGIKSIKDNVEETAKRIKRLTEQSLQISEIVELIADISERTSVLAINATVQATKAGAAGKGFKVVADAVQDLANQASEATRRIGALINAIQTDIQGAGAAMQKTTEEAVKGAELAEITGDVFAEINDTSLALSEIVVEVNEQIGHSARSAAEVSQTMKRVLDSVSESSDATKATSEAIEAINKLSEQLRESVSGFQI